MNTSARRYIGQVKWFNNKAGFGFITMRHDTGVEADIFTHYSTVCVTDSQYKYLVQGEYVEFDLTESTNSKHQYQAANITGINGGSLMCETRQLNRPEKNAHRNREKRVPAPRPAPTPHSPPPPNVVDDDDDDSMPPLVVISPPQRKKRTAAAKEDDSDFTKVQGKRTIQKKRNAVQKK